MLLAGWLLTFQRIIHTHSQAAQVVHYTWVFWEPWLHGLVNRLLDQCPVKWLIGFPVGARDLYLPQTTQTNCGAHQPHIQHVAWTLHPVVKWLGHEANKLPQSGMAIKNGYSCVYPSHVWLCPCARNLL